MLETIITSSLFILLIFLIRTVFRGKVNLLFQYALWLIVAVKLLIFPAINIVSPLSIMNFLKTTSLESMISVQSVLGDTSLKEEASTSEVSSQPGDNDSSSLEEKEKEESQNIPGLSSQEISRENKDEAKISPLISLSPAELLKISFGIGIIVFLFFSIVYNILFYVQIKKNRLLYENNHSSLPIYILDDIKSPFLFMKKIYVAASMTQQEEKMEHIIAHEYCHYKHLDFIWGFIRLLCLAFYWYNPLVWIAAYLSKKDGEMACDAAAIKLLGEEKRIAYGETLIGLITYKTKPSDYMSIATTMTGGNKGIKERISMIAKKPHMAISTVIIIMLFLIMGVIGTFTSSDLQGKISANKIENWKILSQVEEKLGAISMEDTSKGWAMTLDGTLLYTDNGWESYSAIKEFPFGEGAAIWGGNSSLYVFGFLERERKISINHSTDNGISWQESTFDYEENMDANRLYASFPDGEHGYLLHSGGPGAGLMPKILYETKDGGNTYQIAADVSDIHGYPTGMSFSGEGIGFISCTYHGTDDAYLYTSKDCGKTWEPLILPTFNGYENGARYNYINGYAPAFWGSNGSLILEYVFEGDDSYERASQYISYHTEDSGNNWLPVEPLEIPEFDYYSSYSMADDNTLYGIDKNLQLFQTKNFSLMARLGRLCNEYYEKMDKKAYLLRRKPKAEDLFEVGNNAYITHDEVNYMTYVYILSGVAQGKAREAAIKETEKRNALYAYAIKNGCKVSKKEVEEYTNQWKKSILTADDKENYYEEIQMFDSEEQYWDYLFVIHEKALPILKYTESLDEEYQKIYKEKELSGESAPLYEEWVNEQIEKIIRAEEFKLQY